MSESTDTLQPAFRAYRDLSEYNSDGICLIDRDGNIVEANRKCEAISGYAKAELLGKHCTELLLSPDAQSANAWFASGLHGAILHSTGLRLKTKAGKQVPVVYSRVPVIVDEQVIALCVIIKDMSRPHETEQQLARSQQWLESTQRIAHLGCWEFDPVNLRSMWSEELFRIYGIEHKGSGYVDLATVIRYIHPEDQERFIASAQALAEGKPYDVDFRIIRPDGDVRVIHSKRQLFVDDHGETKFIGTAQDITEHKRTEELLLRSERLSAVGQLAAGVAHEIRNPLTVLKGFLKLLPVAEERKPYIEIMENELIHIEKVIEDLLALGKPQPQTFAKVNVVQVVQEVMALLKIQAVSKCIDAELNVEPSAETALVEGDAFELKQAFIHLVKNAIEAAPNAGKVAVHIQLEGDDAMRIDVIDNGTGLSEETVRKLGTPFYTTKEDATGLGLLVSQQIISMHRGQLKIASLVGTGTTVSVILPRLKGARKS
ncbi:PAS domain S-box protein [Alicyclobacillus cycloheptanicus]|uniref:histidine kinase n=1 Tax=Alicyclobacillus cycloheptanicus TaxID=1457 RepID=A0ABT9XDL1_9BACL|nr:PAS domain-containing sensor histidine kinase [Alicyclobacillus cycloheptanicus]MDQ0188381.1 PAS domain S-box-containing protein [Alicyclobacillus cycloheptanicus]WDM01087.1 PAS domain S-box protein [Alicyclobacillus cycloheptanicus]